jgi:D-3-phosphoglycerate dehydrogenase / 2-oxoglutarate reductase
MSLNSLQNTDRKKILITDRFASDAMVTLSQQPFFQVEKTPFPSLREVNLHGVHGLIIRSRTEINEEILKRAKQLQVIITATSGFDHIDLAACEKWGITVMFTPTANVESASQLTWGLVLACANKISGAHRALKAGEWNREQWVGTELAGKTYGIIGLGRIGSRVAEFANTFKMNVIAYDPYVEEQAFVQAGAERVALEEVLKRSDVLSFHVPKTQETHHMLNRSHFEYLNRGMILINTSRGGVIHEADLSEALDKGWLGAVGLDVFEKEPLPRNSKLLQSPNVVMTPHIGAHTTEAFAKASEQAALKMIRFFIDGTTSETLPPKAAWYGAVSPF